MIPCYFRHANFRSFVRQLNSYGFQKTACGNPSVPEFYHSNFVMERPDLLHLIQRKFYVRSSNMTTGSSLSDGSLDCDEKKNTSDRSHASFEVCLNSPQNDLETLGSLDTMLDLHETITSSNWLATPSASLGTAMLKNIGNSPVEDSASSLSMKKNLTIEERVCSLEHACQTLLMNNSDLKERLVSSRKCTTAAMECFDTFMQNQIERKGGNKAQFSVNTCAPCRKRRRTEDSPATIDDGRSIQQQQPRRVTTSDGSASNSRQPTPVAGRVLFVDEEN